MTRGARTPDGLAWAVRSGLAAQYEAFLLWEPGVLPNQPDAIHQTRIALRQLRSLLSVFEVLFEPGLSIPLRQELRWAGKELSAARDFEVLLDRFSAELQRLNADPRFEESLLNFLHQRHSQAAKCAARATMTERWKALGPQLSEFLNGIPTAPESSGRRTADTPAELRSYLPTVERQVMDRVRTAEQDHLNLRLWHEARKSAKTVRYAWEFIASLPGSSDQDQTKAAQWKSFGTALGDLQDTHVALTTLADLPLDASNSGEEIDQHARLLGQLHEKALAEVQIVRLAAKTHFPHRVETSGAPLDPTK